MDDANVVDYDANRGVIESSVGMEDIELYLDVVPDHEIPRTNTISGWGPCVRRC